jgi:hypothetical protein
MNDLILQVASLIPKKLRGLFQGFEEKRPVWSRIARDYFLPSPDIEIGESLNLRAWTQWDGFSCGAVAGWIVVNTFFPNSSWKDFYDFCSPCPDEGLSDNCLVSSLRAFRVGVGIKKAPISFAQIRRTIGNGYPIITTIDCPCENVAHWVVIYGYSEDSKGRKQVYLANNSYRGIHHMQVAGSVMLFSRFQRLFHGQKWYVCWGK